MPGKSKPPWERPRPKSAGRPQRMTAGQKASAKASAKRAGRRYPNWVDNARTSRKGD